MTFAWPQLFWLLLVPAALLAAEFARRRRAAAVVHPKILHAEAGPHDLSFVATPARRRRARGWLCAGLVLCIVALARPQWGRIEEPVFEQAREILIAIDLSRSMLSQDVRPSRLERAKLLTQSLLEKLSGERVGLVSFAGTAFVQSPLSSDYEILREFLPALGPDFLPEGGTNYRALIDTSLAAFGTGTADRYLIILSDGEATDDDWQASAAELKKKGIRVIGLGVGTATGAMIPDGSGGLVKDERGAVVLSKLESGTLQDLASVTGGTYRDASTWLDLAGVLNATVEAGQKGKFLEKNTVRFVERFQWPLAVRAVVPAREVSATNFRSARVRANSNSPPPPASPRRRPGPPWPPCSSAACSLQRPRVSGHSARAITGSRRAPRQDRRPDLRQGRAHRPRLGRDGPRDGQLGPAYPGRPAAGARGPGARRALRSRHRLSAQCEDRRLAQTARGPGGPAPETRNRRRISRSNNSRISSSRTKTSKTKTSRSGISKTSRSRIQQNKDSQPQQGNPQQQKNQHQQQKLAGKPKVQPRRPGKPGQSALPSVHAASATSPQPPSQEETQKVGGVPEKKGGRQGSRWIPPSPCRCKSSTSSATQTPPPNSFN